MEWERECLRRGWYFWEAAVHISSGICYFVMDVYSLWLPYKVRDSLANDSLPNPPELFSSLKDSDKMSTWWGKLFISSRSRSLIKTANVCSYSGSTAAAAATKIKSCHSLSWAHMKKMYICRNISESYFWILLVVFNAVNSHFDVYGYFI